MRKLASLAVLLGLVAIPSLAKDQSFKDVSVVDVNCSQKVAADPDSHPRACALKCAASGYVIVTSDQKILKLDSAGNEKVVAALKASDKKDHLRVDVTGTVEGDTLKVSSLKLL